MIKLFVDLMGFYGLISVMFSGSSRLFQLINGYIERKQSVKAIIIAMATIVSFVLFFVAGMLVNKLFFSIFAILGAFIILRDRIFLPVMYGAKNSLADKLITWHKELDKLLELLM